MRYKQEEFVEVFFSVRVRRTRKLSTPPFYPSGRAIENLKPRRCLQ